MKHIDISIGNISWPLCFASLSTKSNIYLIDVRTEDEWKNDGILDLESKIKNRVKLITWMFFKPFTHINNNFLNELMKEIPNKQSELYFLCRSGKRSYQAAEFAMQAGYENCYNLQNGFTEDMPRIKL